MLETSIAHFTLVGRLGEGGNGVVYKAIDRRLHRAVALKVLRAGLAEDALHRQRFMREARAAASIVHPNVAAIYDVGEDDGRIFIAMELVPGRTLRALLQDGPLPVSRAVAIVASVARALDKAHATGVVHRDLKPDNVMITDEGDVKVVDFGVARLALDVLPPASSRDLDAVANPMSATVEGKLVGTPAYMAPEQARGAAVEARTDIYALGVVLFELLTGTQPFVGDSLDALLHAIIFDPPPRLADRMGTADERLERIVCGCLAKVPDFRYATARELARDLETLSGSDGAVARSAPPSASPSAQTPPARTPQLTSSTLVDRESGPSRPVAPRLRARTAVVVAGLLAIGAAVAAAPSVVAWRASGRDAGASALAQRRTVAVLGLTNGAGAGDTAWIATAASELLTNDLASSEEVRAISRDDVARAKRDLALGTGGGGGDGDGDATGYTDEALTRIARALGADVVVSGSYLVSGAGRDREVRLDVTVQDTARGAMLARVRENGPSADVVGVALRAARALRAALGVKAATAADVATARGSLPGESGAAEQYAEALARVARFDYVGARPRLEELTKTAPDFAPGFALLSEVLRALHEGRLAEAAAAKAFAAAGPLPREERLLVEARYHTAGARWDQATDIYRALYTFFPDDPRYGLALARTQTANGHANDALGTLDRVRRAPRAAENVAAIDLAEAHTTVKLGDARRSLEAAMRAAEGARARGLRGLEATAHGHAADALIMLGDGPRAAVEEAAAERIYAELGDHIGVASRLRPRALRLLQEGDVAGSRALLDRALALFERIGSRYAAAGVHNLIGQTEVELGRFASARRSFIEAIALYRAAGDKEGVANVTLNDGIALTELGELSAARSESEEAIAALRELGMRSNLANAELNLAIALRLQGDLAGAHALVDRTRAEATALGDLVLETDALAVLGVCLADGGDFAGARTAFATSLAARERAGESIGRLDTLLGLARVALDEGRLADAEGHVAAALAEKNPAPDVAARTHEVHARLLLARGRRADAAQAIARALALVKTTESVPTRLMVAIGRAQVADAPESAATAAAAVEATEAAAGLDAAEHEARQLGMVPLELAARLARMAALRARGDATARGKLQALVRDAAVRGQGRIAKLARALDNAPR